MHSRSALTKLKAILIIDLIIVAAAAGTYLYLQNEGLVATAARDAEFVASDLTITPAEAEEAEPVQILANITNIGDLEGTYDANLTINGVLTQNQTLIVPGNKTSVTAEFTVIEETIGNYSVELGGLTGSFTIKAAPPTASNIHLSNVRVTPYEGWVGYPVNVTVIADNPSSENDTLTIKFSVDDVLVESRRIELAAGATTDLMFTVNATSEGKHTFKVNSLTGTFTIVKTGYHTLTVARSGGGSKPMTFQLDGVTQNSPYIALLPVGQYTISAPEVVDLGTGVVGFDYWNTGSKSSTITVDLENDRLIIVASYYIISGYASCPSLYIWNGTDYIHVSEVSNAGWLGYIDYIDENGNMVFGGGNPWDYVKLNNTQLAENNGYFNMTLFQQWDEIYYLDAAYMVVVDHPADEDVYSTMVNYINPAATGQIYSVNKTGLLTPVAAYNEKGENVLPQIASLDGVFTSGSNGLESPSWDNITMNQLTLDLGNLTGAKQIKLVVNGMVDWGDPAPYYDWINQFETAYSQGLVPAGTKVTIPPYMEIMDANGNWVPVPQDRSLPVPADYIPRTFTVDLTGLFPENTSSYMLRIDNFWNVTFDYIGIDVSTQSDMSIYTIYPTATLEPTTFNVHAESSGNFTKFGDVSPLLQQADNMYVIGRQGDQITLAFPTADLPPVADGMERDYFLFVACWFKDPPGNWGYGFDFTVDPLPFINMSGFPYPSTESYPYDAAHLLYLQEYNTRIINPP
jgi:hypothetical protein